MIRRGQKLYSLFPSNLEDHLVSEFGGTDYEVCVQACSLPRWFDLPLLQSAMKDVLRESQVVDCFERLISEDYVKNYGELGYYISDTERYFFLNSAFVQDQKLGMKLLDNMIEHFERQRNTLSSSYMKMASIGYFDAIGVFEIESFHLRLYNSNIETTSVLLSAFERFSEWRADPLFNHGLNRRLVKALRDHLRTGLISDVVDVGLLELMEYSTPPWSNRLQDKQKSMKLYAEPLAAIAAVAPFVRLEHSKLLSVIGQPSDTEEINGLFEVARAGFEALKLPYYQAECFRQQANYLTSIDKFGPADQCLRSALKILESQHSDDETRFVTTIDECWRLIARNYFYAGGEHIAAARKIAESKYAELGRRGNRYMRSLFGILISQIRAEEDPEFFRFGRLFFDTLDILEEAIRHLVAIPDSLDYPNALFQKLVLEISYLENATADRSDKDSVLYSVRRSLEEARHYYTNLSNEQGLANLSYWSASVRYLEQDFDGALAEYTAALETYRKRQDDYGQMNSLMRIGVVAARLDDLPRSKAAYEAALTVGRDHGWQDRFEKGVAQAIARNPDLTDVLRSASTWTEH